MASVQSPDTESVKDLLNVCHTLNHLRRNMELFFLLASIMDLLGFLRGLEKQITVYVDTATYK